MIEHLVLFKFKDGVGEDHMERAVAALRALAPRIPAIVELTAGRNFAARAQGFHVGLMVRLRDREGLAAYAAHPEHVAVVNELIKPFVADLIALDYEFT